MRLLMYIIPFILLGQGQTPEDVFKTLPREKIAVCNWPQVQSYVPEATFAMFHDGDNIYIQYEVDELNIKADVDTLNGPVYKDSCCECFISPNTGDGLYYNFEVNCIGKVLYSCRPGRKDAQRSTLEQTALVKTKSSLGDKAFPERKPDGKWTMVVQIPREAFFKHDIDTFKGKTFKMNVYKCGDDLSTPHYVSWMPIPIERPNFHAPEYFVEVKLGE